MQVAILQPNYIPWRGYFDIIAKVDKFVFYDDAQYTKDDWRNRNRLLGPQGPFWLTIPIKTKGLLGQKINEAMIADHSWQKKHWRSIEVNYAKAPYYFEYCEDIQKLYAQKYSSLVEVNCRFIQKISSLLGLKTEFIYSSQISYRGTRASEKVLSICQLLQGNVYVSGPAAKNYLNG
ncbi:MAG: WbqC family protein, partial [Bdellovibrionales bacterium]|nr:WbqC family protein [Bdellovibrionales bacterium]